MHSNARSESTVIDLEHDVPTTAADVEALRRVRRETPSWLPLPPDVVEALLPEGALERGRGNPAEREQSPDCACHVRFNPSARRHLTRK